jgi:hypothetical protein
MFGNKTKVSVNNLRDTSREYKHTLTWVKYQLEAKSKSILSDHKIYFYMDHEVLVSPLRSKVMPVVDFTQALSMSILLYHGNNALK